MLEENSYAYVNEIMRRFNMKYEFIFVIYYLYANKCLASTIRDNMDMAKVEKQKDMLFYILKHEIEKTENLIVSGEGLIIASYKELCEFKKDIEKYLDIKDIKIVICVRELIDYLNSLKNQLNIDFLNTQEIKYFVKKYAPYKNIENFIKVFGKENIKVYKFEDAKQYKYGIAAYFFKQIGIKEKFLKDLPEYRENTAMSTNGFNVINCLKKRWLYLANFYKPIKIYQSWWYFVEDMRNIPGDKITMSIKEQKKLFANNQENINWLKENFQIDYSEMKTLPYNKPNKKIEHNELFCKQMLLPYFIAHSIVKKDIRLYIKEKINSNKISIDEKNNLINLLERIKHYPKKSFKNVDKIKANSNIAIWGNGESSKQLQMKLEKRKDIKIHYLIDSFSEDKNANPIVKNYKDINNDKLDYIIIASMYAYDIMRTIIENDIDKDKQILTYRFNQFISR